MQSNIVSICYAAQYSHTSTASGLVERFAQGDGRPLVWAHADAGAIQLGLAQVRQVACQWQRTLAVGVGAAKATSMAAKGSSGVAKGGQGFSKLLERNLQAASGQ